MSVEWPVDPRKIVVHEDGKVEITFSEFPCAAMSYEELVGHLGRKIASLGREVGSLEKENARLCEDRASFERFDGYVREELAKEAKRILESTVELEPGKKTFLSWRVADGVVSYTVDHDAGNSSLISSLIYATYLVTELQKLVDQGEKEE